MSTCSACLRRSLKNIEADLPPITYSILFPSSNSTALVSSSSSHRTNFRNPRSIRRPNTPIQRRSHATLASLQKGHHRKQVQFLRDGSNAKNSPVGKARQKKPWAFTKVDVRDAVARERNRARLREETHEIDEIEDVDPAEDGDADVVRPSELREPSKREENEALRDHRSLKESEKQERRLVRQDEKQIEVYYKDPLQLAEGVLQRLRIPDIDGALRLVRASQAYEIKNIVSWNHCCDWLMAQGQIKTALSVYNEMKKRGQKPDAHTYTIMLRGLSQHVDKPFAVQEAVKIYNSIFAPNSAVKPNTIHTNAIINVCARGGDMDSLWAVAGRLPERGPGSPDRITFSTILNAIRENTIKQVMKSADGVKTSKRHGAPLGKEAEEERSILYAKAVDDGRKMWEDISHRWRRADLVIDEQLVCAMGRLLLACGVDRDIEQVLDLVEVTMNLRLKERAKRGDQQVSWLEGSIGTSNLPLQESNVYATPGPNTLSMLLEACSQKRSIQHYSKLYWRHLTNPNGTCRIRPDAGNIIMYLRLLRQQRASAEALELLSYDWPESVAKVLYRRASFIVALSTCLRDKNNPNVFKTAQKLLKLAEEKFEERAVGMFDENVKLGDMNYHLRKRALQDMKKQMADMIVEEQEEMARNKEGVQSITVDPKIMSYFLELAISTTGGWNEGVRGKDDGTVFERHPTKNNTMSALMAVTARTKDLRRLVKAKMDELQNTDMPRRRRQDALDPRGGSRVGEDIIDMLELMRTMISGWDKCLEVHERFTKAGREGLDEKLMAGFRDRKREMTAYMARVENSMGQKVRQNKEFESVRKGEDAVDEEAEQDEDGIMPDIERRIKAVLEGVNSEIVQSRVKDKNSRGSSVRRYGDTNNIPLKITSRRQHQERENLIEKRVGKAFPKADYGSLNSELEIVSGDAAEQSQREEQRRLSSRGFARGLNSRPRARTDSGPTSGMKRLRERRGPESPRRYESSESKSPDDGNNYSPAGSGYSFSMNRRPPGSSMLDRADVRSAWRRPDTAAAGSG